MSHEGISPERAPEGNGGDIPGSDSEIFFNIDTNKQMGYINKPRFK